MSLFWSYFVLCTKDKKRVNGLCFLKEAANLKTQRNYSIFHRTPYFIYLFITHEAAKKHMGLQTHKKPDILPQSTSTP